MKLKVTLDIVVPDDVSHYRLASKVEDAVADMVGELKADFKAEIVHDLTFVKARK